MEKTPLKPEKIPASLKITPQWVAWNADKIPVNPNSGGNAMPNARRTWGTYRQALKYFTDNESRGIMGVGFNFSDNDPFAGVDLDNCRAPETGIIEQWAQEIINLLNSYTEISPSGKGVHILLKGQVPSGGNRKDLVEMYSQGRYFTVTGDHLVGTPTTIEDRATELTSLHNEIFTQKAPKTSLEAQPPSPIFNLSDPELIEKALQAKNGEKFRKLWGGDISDYPSNSEATLALLRMLAFWCGPNPERIEQLYRQSGLKRDKWYSPRSGSTWGELQIKKAIASTTEFYTPSSEPKDMMVLTPEIVQGNGAQLAFEFNPTDMGNAQRLVARHGQNIRYCKPWKEWLVWNEQRWIKDNTLEVERLAKDTVRNIYNEASEAKTEEIRRFFAKHAINSESEKWRKAMISTAKSEPGIAILPEDFDSDPWLFNCLNGTLDLRTGNLREQKRDDLITKIAPVEYRPSATCPIWLNFLDQIMNGNKYLTSFLQKAVGYSLTGDTREQCLFFFYGLGANGKTTYLDVIGTMLGDYAVQTSTETFLVKKGNSIPNDIAALRSARFVSAVEVERGKRLAEVLIKQMTGGDKIAARLLYAEMFEFKPEFKIFLAANHKPVIQGLDNAIWRRIHLIPFTVEIPRERQDRELPNKLREELSGILNWAIEGCLKWREEGLRPPNEVVEATIGYRDEMDILRDFLSDCCVETAEASVGVTILYRTYNQWAQDGGEKTPLTQKGFKTALIERGFKSNRSTGGRYYWFGIMLKDSEQSE